MKSYSRQWHWLTVISITLFLMLSSLAGAYNPLYLNPQQLSFELKQGETAWSVFTINNNLPALTWNITEDTTAGTSISSLDAGGADSYGYSWMDSNETDGPVYNWLDITSTGTRLTGMADDDVLSAYIPLKFKFDFYGSQYTTLRACSNGWISFTSSSTSYSNTTIPNSTSAPENLIAPYWDDMDMSNSGSIYYQSDTGRFVITYENVPSFSSSSSRYTFQVILYPWGDIVYQYKELSGATNSATVGMQNASRTVGLQIAYNQLYLQSGMAIKIARGLTWAEAEPRWGITPGGSYSVVTAHINAKDLPVGDTTGYFIVQSYNQDSSMTPLNLQLNVKVNAGDAVLSVTPQSIDFGNTYTGETAASQVITLKNTGYSELTATIALPGLPFQATGASPVILGHNEYSIYSTYFLPTSFGAQTGNLTIYEEDAYGKSTVECQLTGVGVAYPEMEASPLSISTTLMQGQIAYSLLTIKNIAANAGPLSFSIQEKLYSVGELSAESQSTLTALNTASVVPSDYHPFTVQKGKKYVKDELIVKYKKGITQTSRLKTQSTAGTETMKYLPLIDAYRVKITSGKTMEETLSKYSAKSELVEFAEPNYLVYAKDIPNDPGYSNLWGMATIQAPSAWSVSTGSSDIIIGVIDTGVDYTHGDLAANIWHNPGEIPFNGIDDDGNGYVDDTVGWDFYNNDNDPSDDHYHGTHVSGTIAGVGNNGIGVTGVMWKAKIMPLKFLNSSGNGNTADAIEALQYAIKNGARITNNSWGGGGYETAMYSAISAANTAHQLFVVAAGNESNDNDASPAYPSSYNLPNVISVAATGSSDNLASFSNYGITGVDLGAPGVMIYSTAPGNSYMNLSGTSMATPHVAGACGLIWSMDTGMNYLDVRNSILNGVDVIPALTGKCVTGGRLNLKKSMGLVGVSWLDEYPMRGEVLSGNYSIVSVAISAVSLSVSTVSARLAVYDGVENHTPVYIPVQLIVTPGSPELTLSSPTVNFGSVYLNQTSRRVIRMTNTGYQQLTASSIVNSGDFDYSGPSSITLDRQGYTEMTVTFNVTSVGSKTGTITIYSNDTAYPVKVIPVTGIGVYPPKWLSAPANISNTLPNAAISYSYLTIKNNLTGYVGNLDWQLSEAATTTAWVSINKAGGSAANRYQWMDSDNLNGPVYQWLDISSTGTKITGLADDINVGPYNVGFNFPFYGSTYSTFRFCSNGWLSFSNSGNDWENLALPNSNAPELLVAPFWDDLNMSNSGSAYYQSDGEKLVVSWLNVPPWEDSGHYTFQAILYKTGEIVFQYKEMVGVTQSATVGIQDAAKTSALQVAYDADYVKDNLAVRIWQGVNWFSVEPSSGSLAPGEMSIVTCRFDSTGVTDTTTTAFILAGSNDPDNAKTVIPVTMNISNEVTADFYATPTSGASPLEVQFYDASQGYVTSWRWEFGDGTHSMEKNPVHVYTSPTTTQYSVLMIAVNDYSSSTAIKYSYITVEPGSLKISQKLPDIKMLKGQTLANAFDLDDYSDWKGAAWGWWSESGENQVNLSIAQNLNTVSYQTTTDPDFTGMETIRFTIPSWNSEGTTNHVKYSDYLLSKFPNALVDDGKGIENVNIPLVNYVQPALPASWPVPQVRYLLASDTGKLQAVISNDTLQLSALAPLDGAVEVILTVSGSTSTSWDKEILNVYELRNIYGQFTASSDTSMWAFETLTDNNITYPLAGQSWLPEYSGATGVLCLSFGTTQQAVKMTSALDNWANPTSGQWYTARMRVMSDTPNMQITPCLFLFNGIQTTGMKIAGRVALSAPTTWRWMETALYADGTGGVYPQIVVRNSTSTETGRLYIDDIQMYPAPSPLAVVYGNPKVYDSKGDWDSMADTTGWGMESVDGLPIATYGQLSGQFNAQFDGSALKSLKLTGMIQPGVTNTLAVQENTASGFGVDIAIEGALKNNLSMVVVYGTDSVGGTEIKEIGATALVDRYPASSALDTFFYPEYPYLYGQVVLKNAGAASVLLDNLYLQKDSDLPNYWDSSLF
jgi:subtilisin family serine protease/PKD repeat protein